MTENEISIYKLKEEVERLKEDNIALWSWIGRFSRSYESFVNNTNRKISATKASIEILGADGWEEFSGNFEMGDEETEKVVIRKAKKHFKKHFIETFPGRTFRIVSIIHSKKRTIKEIKT